MILLVGYGNTLRRDDGVGPMVVRRVAERVGRADLRALCCHQLTPELAAELSASEVEAAIFVDAATDPQAGEKPATSFQLRPLSGSDEPVPSGHHLTPGVLLALAEKLYGRAPSAWLAEIPAVDFAFGEGLSDLCRRHASAAEEGLLDWVAAISRARPRPENTGESSGEP